MYTNYAMIFVWSGEEVKLGLKCKKIHNITAFLDFD